MTVRVRIRGGELTVLLMDVTDGLGQGRIQF